MTTPQDWREEFERIVDGIDKDQCEYEYGWWETSMQAQSGAKTKQELLQLIQSLLTTHTTELIAHLEGMRRTDETQMSHDHVYDEAISDIQEHLRSNNKGV